IWAPNLPEWVLLQLATARIGAVLVPINTAYRGPEAEYVLRQSDLSTLFMVEEVRGFSYLDAVYSIVPELRDLAHPTTDTLDSGALPRLRRVVLLGRVARPGVMGFADLLALEKQVSDGDLRERQTLVRPDDVAMIIYTSGTTGAAKGAMLTHF